MLEKYYSILQFWHFFILVSLNLERVVLFVFISPARSHFQSGVCAENNNKNFANYPEYCSAMPSEESYKQIEGEWKDFRFRRVLPADYEATLDHIAQNYCRDEFTCKLLGWNEEFAADVNKVVAQILPEGLSFIAEHIPTGKIAGARITLHHKPETKFATLDNRNAKLFFKLVNDVEDLADVTTKHGIDNWAEFFMASTSRDFRNQGLVGEFYNRSINFLKAEGFKHALVVVTSPYTKQATIKRGFEQQSRLDYENFMDFDEKTPVFKKEDLSPQDSALVMLKKL